jgi:hypothetical protein
VGRWINVIGTILNAGPTSASFRRTPPTRVPVVRRVRSFRSSIVPCRSNQATAVACYRGYLLREKLLPCFAPRCESVASAGLRPGKLSVDRRRIRSFQRPGGLPSDGFRLRRRNDCCWDPSLDPATGGRRSVAFQNNPCRWPRRKAREFKRRVRGVQIKMHARVVARPTNDDLQRPTAG